MIHIWSSMITYDAYMIHTWSSMITYDSYINMIHTCKPEECCFRGPKFLKDKLQREKIVQYNAKNGALPVNHPNFQSRSKVNFSHNASASIEDIRNGNDSVYDKDSVYDYTNDEGYDNNVQETDMVSEDIDPSLMNDEEGYASETNYYQEDIPMYSGMTDHRVFQDSDDVVHVSNRSRSLKNDDDSVSL